MLEPPSEPPCGDEALVDGGYISATAVAEAEQKKAELEEAMGWNVIPERLEKVINDVNW